MSADISFESAQFLAHWSGEEIVDAKQELKSLKQSNNGTVISEYNGKTELYEAKMVFEKPSHRLRGRLSNVIKNLKDSLDQAAHAASVYVKGERVRNAHFPFGENPDDWDVAVTRNQCRDIPSVLYPILKSYEPYHTGSTHAGGSDSLKILSKISGSHKHRTSLVNTFAPSAVDMSVKAWNAGRAKRKVPSIFCFLEEEYKRDNELVLATYGDGGNFSGSVNVELFVAFSHPLISHVPAVDFLQECQLKVSQIVHDLELSVQKIPRSGG